MKVERIFQLFYYISHINYSTVVCNFFMLFFVIICSQEAVYTPGEIIKLSSVDEKNQLFFEKFLLQDNII